MTWINRLAIAIGALVLFFASAVAVGVAGNSLWQQRWKEVYDPDRMRLAGQGEFLEEQAFISDLAGHYRIEDPKKPKPVEKEAQTTTKPAESTDISMPPDPAAQQRAFDEQSDVASPVLVSPDAAISALLKTERARWWQRLLMKITESPNNHGTLEERIDIINRQRS